MWCVLDSPVSLFLTLLLVAALLKSLHPRECWLAGLIAWNMGRLLGFPLTAAFPTVVAGLALPVIQNRGSVQNNSSSVKVCLELGLWGEGGSCLCLHGKGKPLALTAGGQLPEALLAQAAQLLQKLEEVIAEFDANEGVEERIEAASEASQSVGHIICHVQLLALLTRAGVVEGWDGLGQHDTIVGQLEDNKDNYHSNDDLDGFILLEVAGLE